MSLQMIELDFTREITRPLDIRLLGNSTPKIFDAGNRYDGARREVLGAGRFRLRRYSFLHGKVRAASLTGPQGSVD